MVDQVDISDNSVNPANKPDQQNGGLSRFAADLLTAFQDSKNDPHSRNSGSGAGGYDLTNKIHSDQIVFSSPYPKPDGLSPPASGAGTSLKKNTWTDNGKYAVVETDAGGVGRAQTYDGRALIRSEDGIVRERSTPRGVSNPSTDGDVEIWNGSKGSTLNRSDGSTVEKDQNGRVTSVNYANGQSRHFVYGDNSEVPQEIHDPNGNKWKLEDGKYIEYDRYVDGPGGGLAFGNKTGRTDSRTPGVSQDGTYTLKGENGEVQEFYTDGGSQQKYGYGGRQITDRNGAVTNVMTMEGSENKYVYKNGDLTKVQVDPEGNYKEIDPANPAGGTWHKRDGSVVTLDDTGKVVGVQSSSRGNLNRSFTYDGDGKIIAYTDAGSANWQRGANGAFEEVGADGNKTGRATPPDTKVELDALGNQIWITGTTSRKVEWTDGRTTEDIVSETGS